MGQDESREYRSGGCVGKQEFHSASRPSASAGHRSRQPPSVLRHRGPILASGAPRGGNSMDPNTPIQYLKGVGPPRAALLKRLEIQTVRDLLWHLPRAWLDRSRLTPLPQLVPGAQQTAVAVVRSVHLRRVAGGMTIFEAELEGDGGFASAAWFNQPFLAERIRPGQFLLLSGPVRSRPGRAPVHAPRVRDPGRRRHRRRALGRADRAGLPAHRGSDAEDAARARAVGARRSGRPSPRSASARRCGSGSACPTWPGPSSGCTSRWPPTRRSRPATGSPSTSSPRCSSPSVSCGAAATGRKTADPAALARPAPATAAGGAAVCPHRRAGTGPGRDPRRPRSARPR